MITVKEAKKIINIFSVWELLNLPGSPGKSCKAPHREAGVHLFPFMIMVIGLRTLVLEKMEM